MTTHARDANPLRRVLIYAPVGRDAELTQDLLTRASITSVICLSLSHAADMLASEGGDALLLTQEALDDPDLSELVAMLEQQPPWADVPVLLFAGGPGVELTGHAMRSIERLRNVTLLERPIRVAAVMSAVRAALRSRARQYEVRDLLTALHRARADAESANRLKDEFLATLSHELRTPLNAILGWTSMLARGEVDAKRLPRVFQALDRNAQAQAQLIADVLDVSRIITGKLQLHVAAVDLSEIIEAAADAVRPAADARSIQLRVQQARDCVVNGDPDRLRQVFWNLLSNAVKFTPARGSVAVDVTRDENTVSVAVIDTGIGIAPEFVPFVFDRFRQADQTTTRTHSGLGLGLSIVKHLTELHGGTVSASSRGAGYGARFDVRLPVVDADVPTAEHPARGRNHLALEGYSVLVVDDDESTREVVSAALEAAHAHVRTAASAREAREQLSDDVPAVIIADLGMPVEDGLSFIRSVRQSAGRHIPAIALSAYADAASRDAALSAGFTAFLAKPTRPDPLVDLVMQLLGDAVRRDPERS